MKPLRQIEMGHKYTRMLDRVYARLSIGATSAPIAPRPRKVQCRCSKHDGRRGPAYALYERAMSSIPSKPAFDRALGDAALLPYVEAAALRFGYALV